MADFTTTLDSSTRSDEQISVLIVDDSSVDRQMIVYACSKLNAETEMAADGDEAIELFKEKRHRLVITDYLMEPMSGLELSKKLREIDPSVEIIIVSGSPSPDVIEYVQSNDLAPIVTKPISPSALINNATICLGRKRGRREVLRDVALTNRMDDCLPLLGCSDLCEQLRLEITKLIQSPDPVLITGPTACGKLQIAHFVHQQGTYGDSICMECYCSKQSPEELSQSLISESGELGEMVQATRNGTLIIHNIEALPMPLQKALAASYDDVTAKTHLILLSDASLDSLLDDGLIYESLYFKLSLWTFQVPALIERIEDLPDLVSYICRAPEKYNLSPEAANAEYEAVLKVVNQAGLEKNFASLAFAIQRSVL